MTTYSHEDWYEAERLHRAGRDGDVQEIERLIIAGYDVNLFDDMGYTPLHHAVEGEQIEAVKVLLERGALINANDDATIGETPLSLAVQGRALRGRSSSACVRRRSGHKRLDGFDSWNACLRSS